MDATTVDTRTMQVNRSQPAGSVSKVDGSAEERRGSRGRRRPDLATPPLLLAVVTAVAVTAAIRALP